MYFLHYDHGFDWKLSALIEVGVVGPLMGLAVEVLDRHLGARPVRLKVVGDGRMCSSSRASASSSAAPRASPPSPYLPSAAKSVEISGTFVTSTDDDLRHRPRGRARFLLFFRRSRTRVAMRSVVDDTELVRLHGTNARRSNGQRR